MVVTFKVKAPTKWGEYVGIVGNCPELKNWDPNAVIFFQKMKVNLITFCRQF